MLRDDIMALKKEVKELREKSFSYELLQDMKKQNKRMFIIIIVILAMFTALLGYTIYLLNDIGTIEETTTQEVSQDNENGNNNFIGNDGDIINGKAEN